MIKILACIFMLIDHIGALFFPEIEALRFIGRLAMPMFAYCIAKGVETTHDKVKYFKRVLIIAIIALVPYCIMIKGFILNICFLWCFTIIFFILKDKIQDEKTLIFTILAFVIMIAYMPIEYTFYGFLYVIITYKYIHHKKRYLFLIHWTILHVIYACVDIQSALIQLYTLPAIFICDISEKAGLEKKPIKNIVIQYFYPAHMVILLLIFYFFLR